MLDLLLPRKLVLSLLLLSFVASGWWWLASVAQQNCPAEQKYGPGPPSSCTPPSDPNNKPPSPIEQWFTQAMFDDLFPFANLGWGGNKCLPYSYQSFIIACRYFPQFGTSSPQNGLDPKTNTCRDVAAFFAHAIQETGCNDISLYTSGLNTTQADNCFYRGGMYNWFEGGPMSSFMNSNSPGLTPPDGNACYAAGRYCSPSDFWPCGNGTQTDSSGQQQYKSCYFGRGAIQLSYNFNYGQLQDWLKQQNIIVDLLTQPNLLMTQMNPPLAMLASLWFFMTPQPPKPAMHDIVLGNWNAGPQNQAAGFSGPCFGPTSLIINNECEGMDATAPGGGGENRRIRAFIWFCQYFNVSAGNATTLTCKNMPQRFDQMSMNVSYQPDWSSTWQNQPCACAPAPYGGAVPYFQAGFYPQQFVAQNPANQRQCVEYVYQKPYAFNMDPSTSPCLNYPPSSIDPTKMFYKNATKTKLAGNHHKPPGSSSAFIITSPDDGLVPRAVPDTPPPLTVEVPEEPPPIYAGPQSSGVMVATVDGLRAYIAAHRRDCPALGRLLEDERIRDRLEHGNIVEVTPCPGIVPESGGDGEAVDAKAKTPAHRQPYAEENVDARQTSAMAAANNSAERKAGAN